ncbi:MAG: hypothetical protein A3K03_07900 [Bdellovibrionales bacterium RIFOXYD1_FULL_44_7]|nr:MAG: hypothetical protein A3K03_07900 [Bdellovibrionales bacterium RIFOXYD1_FULL_44_7]
MKYCPINALLNNEIYPQIQTIETSSSFNIPSFSIIGLPGPEVAEARERVRSAILASGYEFPKRRIVVNLSPASVKKHGTGIDLAIALAILSVKAKQITKRKIFAWGELGLDGVIKPAGQITRALHAAWQSEAELLMLSEQDSVEAKKKYSLIQRSNRFQTPGPIIITAKDLKEAFGCLQENRSSAIFDVAAENANEYLRKDNEREEFLKNLLPLPLSVKKILGVSAAGNHHILLLGPKGAGKSHATEWLIALQPNSMAKTEIERLLISELVGQNTGVNSNVRRIGPQARPASLCGSINFSTVRPGEFSLAHGGLLIADEFPEWNRDSREILREPLERSTVTLTRTKQSIELPAAFTLVANGNFCPCGGWPSNIPRPRTTVRDSSHPTMKISKCRCSNKAKQEYLFRLSGPILDRIDIILSLIGTTQIQSDGQEQSDLFEKVDFVRSKSIALLGKPAGWLQPQELEHLLRENPSWREHLESFSYESLRSRHKLLRIALSLAFWDKLDQPKKQHFIEASFYRPERFSYLQ